MPPLLEALLPWVLIVLIRAFMISQASRRGISIPAVVRKALRL